MLGAILVRGSWLAPFSEAILSSGSYRPALARLSGVEVSV